MDNILTKTKNFILDTLFPKFCLGCQREGSYLCEDCHSLLDICEYSYCLCDKNPLRLPPKQNLGKCRRCSDKKISGLYFALSYKEGTLTKKLIHQFKYQPYLKDLSKTLANIIIEHLVISKKNTEEIWKNSVLLAVPLDKKKFRLRNYNQSEELAKELSSVLGVPLLYDVLLKTKITKPQVELSKKERENNLRGAFQINPSIKANTLRCPHISGKKIFLVDDVYTTGSTMQECASVLKEAGARQVWGICIARESL